MKLKYFTSFLCIIVLSLFCCGTQQDKIKVNSPWENSNTRTGLKVGDAANYKPHLLRPPYRIAKVNNIKELPTIKQGEPVVRETQVTKSEKKDYPEESIPVLMYHSISTIPGNNLGVPVKEFAEEMKWLKSRNYISLSLEDFYEALVHNKPVPPKSVLITFDDGYEDNYTSAWPILQKNGFIATFFIITSSVGSGMMNWEQLMELSSQGNTIASHTLTHPDLSKISSEIRERELANSKEDIENRLGKNVSALCFPSGRYNVDTLEQLPRLGYKLGFTTNPGKVRLGDNPLTLKRVRIPGGMSLTSFQKLFP